MSPTVFREGGIRVFFFSREEARMHVHVQSAEAEAKFWMEPLIELAVNFGFRIEKLVEFSSCSGNARIEIREAWQRHLSG